MTIQEAIQVRHSVRQYKDIAIEAEKIAQLQVLIDKCNREAGVHIQLVTNEPNAFSGGLAKYHFEVAAGKENFEWITL